MHFHMDGVVSAKELKTIFESVGLVSHYSYGHFKGISKMFFETSKKLNSKNATENDSFL